MLLECIRNLQSTILIAVPYGLLIFMGSNFHGFREVSLSLEKLISFIYVHVV